MDKVQKKLVQGIFKIWEAVQKDDGRFLVQDIPDVGLVAVVAFPHTAAEGLPASV